MNPEDIARMTHTKSSGQMDPGWQAYLDSKESYTRGVPLEAPMFSPDDLLGGGLLTKAAAVIGALRAMPKKVIEKVVSHTAPPQAAAAVNALRAMPPQAEAMRLAQQRAALPVEQGGLGLRPDNTPQQRAAAMGFDIPFQHGTSAGDITAFDMAKTQKSDAGYLGQAIYGSEPGSTAYTGGGVVYPLVAQSEKLQRITPENWNINSPYSEVAEGFARNWGNKEAFSREYTKNKLASGIKGILDISGGKGVDQIAIYDPHIIRSRFAAFDPWRRNAAVATAMGVAAPDLLADEGKKGQK
jgi:hypothetical protein